MRRNSAAAETHEFVAKTHHSALVALTKAHVDMYTECAAVQNELLKYLTSEAEKKIGGEPVHVPAPAPAPAPAADAHAAAP